MEDAFDAVRGVSESRQYWLSASIYSHAHQVDKKNNINDVDIWIITLHR